MLAALQTKTTTITEPDINESDRTMSQESSVVDWAALVAQVRDGDPAGMEELYTLFARGIRYHFYRHLGAQDLEDKIHDTFLIVVQAIRKGDLREPERLMGFVRTIVRRQVASHIDRAVHTRREETSLDTGCPLPDSKENPEDHAVASQQMDILTRTLNALAPRDREILTRFYLWEQSQAQICREMRLTDTQFRLLKSRAKARFGELGRRKMDRKPPNNVFVRVLSALRH
jgi:RNA polymerase sigma-70 factor, ECF subfamily